MDERRYLLNLISEGEHQQQDFKYKVQDAMKLAKSVSAFANTDGGRLLIGVRDDGHMSGVRCEEEIYMMHQAAYRYCRPASSIKFDTYHIDGRTIVVATIPPSDKRPIMALDADGKPCAYIRIADENIVASPVHLCIWREQQRPTGTMMAYTDNVRRLLEAMGDDCLTLNQIVHRSGVPRQKVISLLARLVRFRVASWEYKDRQFLFCLTPAAATASCESRRT